jgi:hypothetical protein
MSHSLCKLRHRLIPFCFYSLWSIFSFKVFRFVCSSVIDFSRGRTRTSTRPKIVAVKVVFECANVPQLRLQIFLYEFHRSSKSTSVGIFVLREVFETPKCPFSTTKASIIRTFVFLELKKLFRNSL